MDEFHAAHFKRYGHSFDLPVELVHVRVQVEAQRTPLSLASLNGANRPLTSDKRLNNLEVYERAGFLSGDRFSGPALIIEQVATSYIAAGWQCEVDQWGHLHLSN